MHIWVDSTEQELEEPQESAQAEETNLVQEQGKPLSLSFVYLYILIVILACALSSRSWIDALVP
jgi:hypothetical protein